MIAAVLALAGLIAAHHSGMLMDMQHHEGGMAAVVEMCLGVATAVGATLLAAGLSVVALARRHPQLALLATGVVRTPDVPDARTRHGPATVSVLCVSRC